jgi:hypothetical protein
MDRDIAGATGTVTPDGRAATDDNVLPLNQPPIFILLRPGQPCRTAPKRDSVRLVSDPEKC